MAAPVFRTFASAGNGIGTSVTVVKPSGTVENDILLACLYLENQEAVTPPSGFAELTGAGGTQVGYTPDYDVHIFWKRAGASEPANYTFSWTTSNWRTIWMARCDGTIASGDPTDPESFLASATSSLSMTAPGVTTTVDDTLILFCGTNGDSRTVTPPSGMTERIEFSNVYLATVAQTSAGATGDKTATLSDTSWNTGSLVVLKPPAGETPVNQTAISAYESLVAAIRNRQSKYESLVTVRRQL